MCSATAFSVLTPLPSSSLPGCNLPPGAACIRCGLQPASRVSRRVALVGISGIACLSGLTGIAGSLRAPALEARAEEPPPGLPDGARQFNNLRSARDQWADVGGVLARDGPIAEEEWGNLRGFLRVFFKVGEDIDFLGKGFSVEGRNRTKEIVKGLRKMVKDMDKVASEEKREDFRNAHAQVLNIVDEFIAMLSEANSDVPQDL